MDENYDDDSFELVWQLQRTRMELIAWMLALSFFCGSFILHGFAGSVCVCVWWKSSIKTIPSRFSNWYTHIRHWIMMRHKNLLYATSLFLQFSSFFVSIFSPRLFGYSYCYLFTLVCVCVYECIIPNGSHKASHGALRWCIEIRKTEIVTHSNSIQSLIDNAEKMLRLLRQNVRRHIYYCSLNAAVVVVCSVSSDYWHKIYGAVNAIIFMREASSLFHSNVLFSFTCSPSVICVGKQHLATGALSQWTDPVFIQLENR